jgi:mannitol/fructose-specific phosphotransferase system IIA component (Ntr-type)
MVKKPLVIVGRSAGGIEWDSPDGREIEFVFLILTPAGDDDSQVQILGHIARVMSDEAMRDEMRSASDAAAMWSILHGAFAPQVVSKRK